LDVHGAAAPAAAPALLVAGDGPVRRREARRGRGVAAAAAAVAGIEVVELALDEDRLHRELVQDGPGAPEVVARVAVDEGTGTRITALGRRGVGQGPQRRGVSVEALLRLQAERLGVRRGAVGAR